MDMQISEVVVTIITTIVIIIKKYIIYNMMKIKYCTLNHFIITEYALFYNNKLI